MKNPESPPCASRATGPRSFRGQLDLAGGHLLERRRRRRSSWLTIGFDAPSAALIWKQHKSSQMIDQPPSELIVGLRSFACATRPRPLVPLWPSGQRQPVELDEAGRSAGWSSAGQQVSWGLARAPRVCGLEADNGIQRQTGATSGCSLIKEECFID